MSERSDDGGGGGIPWASVFDPVANARALEQIQRRGLRAAGDIVDRLVAVVDGAREHDVTTNGDGAPTAPTANGADPFGIWADLMTQTLQAMSRLGVPDGASPQQPTGGPVWVDVVSGRGSGAFVLALDSGAEKEPAAGELWLHNASEHAVGPLRLHVGELRSPEGATLASSAVSVDPASIDGLPARSSRGVTASIDASVEVAAGRYRGLLQIDGADAVAVSVELTVAEPA